MAGRPTVLVVDDERFSRDALSRELAGEYGVIAVPGAEEAFEVLGKRSDLAAVITDLVMRGAALPRFLDSACPEPVEGLGKNGSTNSCRCTLSRLTGKTGSGPLP